MVLAVLAIIFTLILVVGIHEAGHALVAGIFKIKIKKISIGFGKPLVQWRSAGGCEWIWGLWPLGGYVQLLNTRISPVEPDQYLYCFDKKPIWIRLFVLVAGALANLITAWLAFLLVFLMGMSVRSPQIDSVQTNSIAAQSGILAGDYFVAIDGHETPSWREVGMELVILWGKKDVKVTVRQSNRSELKNLILNLSQINLHGRENSLLNRIGISPNRSSPINTIQCHSLLDAMHQATESIMKLGYFLIMVLKQLFTGVIPFSFLLGPLGLFAVSVASLTQGIAVFMYFIASLSLAVAVVNLFPVPGLDGGGILYSIIEKIRGKPLSVAMEVLVYQLVLIVFCLLLVQLVMNDVQRFYS